MNRVKELNQGDRLNISEDLAILGIISLVLIVIGLITEYKLVLISSVVTFLILWRIYITKQILIT